MLSPSPGGWVSLASLAILGALSGGLFSVVLGIAGRYRTFQDMSVRLFAAGGASAAVLLHAAWSLVVLWGDPIPAAAFFPPPLMMVLGAGCATGSLVLARMAEDDGQLEASNPAAELLGGDQGVANRGPLTEPYLGPSRNPKHCEEHARMTSRKTQFPGL